MADSTKISVKMEARFIREFLECTSSYITLSFMTRNSTFMTSGSTGMLMDYLLTNVNMTGIVVDHIIFFHTF